MEFEESEIRDAISNLGFDSDGELRWLSGARRIYSNVQAVEITSAGEQKKFLLKSGGNLLEKNVSLNEIARNICTDQPQYFQPKMAYLESRDLIITEFFEGNSLSHGLRFRFRQSPLAWRRKLLKHAGMAGEWLRNFHEVSAEREDISQYLTSYIANRTERLVLLPEELRFDLLSAIEKPWLVKCSLSHGDFTSQNILINENSLCVIDFGVREWNAMMPEWDLASFLIGIRRSSMFSPLSVLRWLPYLMKECSSAFLQAYGREVHQKEYLLACALRHFTYFPDTDSLRVAMDWDRRSKWHYSEFCGAINKLNRLR